LEQEIWSLLCVSFACSFAQSELEMAAWCFSRCPEELFVAIRSAVTMAMPDLSLILREDLDPLNIVLRWGMGV
jgi:hypothetical protein